MITFDPSGCDAYNDWTEAFFAIGFQSSSKRTIFSPPAA